MIVFWRVVWYRAGTFLCMRSWPRRARRARPSCPSVVPGHAWPPRLWLRGFCVAAVWLRHADKC